ncbi:GmrSD restriction endonuclease domain-containing protein [Sphingomonas glaciei]|uniref:DUF262 domain-containing protein n=1 Tax=Sphingomonas glaciei TaxID=2938948 RepID=A0ABY5MSY2_9SPHN|nr:DUF262 domain-containing protein [Sphingomonas glaciei]UUR07599.1 DUF262 domain-containing protein [Sphingomonas glaciei]
MSGTVDSYVNLVEQAYRGHLKLPAFQRDFKWNRKQVVLLFDSIRQGYPLNGMIQIEGNHEEFEPRDFFGSGPEAASQAPKRLVLDGQQRLTAGIHLFFNNPGELKSQYFVDLNKLEKNIHDCKIDIENDDHVRLYLADLDVDSGYLVARSSAKDPYALLNKSDLLFTPLLISGRAKDRSTYFESYLSHKPSRKNLIRNVIESHFIVSGGPSIPLITIESTFKIEAISRIFATLNSTGKVLTPFELVVAVLFRQVDLRKGIASGKQGKIYYPQMDSTGEIALQTAVLFAGESPKKSTLPKTLTAEIWTKHSKEAFTWLDVTGKFLSDRLGMALDITASLIPYDSIFAPMAKVMKEIDYPSISGKELASVNAKLSKWVVGAALDQRYQEGVHGKQKDDADDVLAWIKNDHAEPDWLALVRVPPLTLATPMGARGLMIRALFNRSNLEDPVNQKPINLGTPTAHLHHVFPTKYVSKLTGWDEKNDKANLLLNTMQLDAETNTTFLNDDPALQVQAAEEANPKTFSQSYAAQGIDSSGLALMRKAHKTKNDFINFIKIRETVIEKMLEEFDFTKSGSAPEIDDQEDA